MKRLVEAGTGPVSSSPRRLSRVKKWRSRLMAVVGSVIVTLLVSEIILRTAGFRPEAGSSYLGDDSQLAWVPRASVTVEQRGLDYSYTISTNSLGLRGGELSPAIRNRLLILGDSYTFGVGVDDGDCFPAQLQAFIGEGCQVVNAGVSGYGALQSFLRAKQLWPDVHPQVVVYTHCGNDFGDDLRTSRGTYEDLRNALPGRRFLKEYSAMYAVCKPLVLSIMSTIRMYNPPIEFESQGEGGLVSRLGQEWSHGRDLTCAALRDMKQLAEASGARFFVTTVGFVHEEGELRFSSDAQAVIDYAVVNEMPFLDPRAPFEGHPVDAWYNSHSAGHFSKEGNRWFAEALRKGLEAHGVRF